MVVRKHNRITPHARQAKLKLYPQNKNAILIVKSSTGVLMKSEGLNPCFNSASVVFLPEVLTPLLQNRLWRRFSPQSEKIHLNIYRFFYLSP